MWEDMQGAFVYNADYEADDVKRALQLLLERRPGCVPFAWPRDPGLAAVSFRWREATAFPAKLMLKHRGDSGPPWANASLVRDKDAAAALLEASLREKLERRNDTCARLVPEKMVWETALKGLSLLNPDETREALQEALLGVWDSVTSTFQGASGELLTGCKWDVAQEHQFWRFLSQRSFPAPSHLASLLEPIPGATPHQSAVMEVVQRHLWTKGWACLLGPGGTGKTYLVGEVCKRLASLGARSLLLGPTNRAVAVLWSVAQHVGSLEAATLHQFALTEQCKEDDPPSLVVIDEASMLSAEHAKLLWDRRETLADAAILFVGDTLQLLPVGPGEVLRPLTRALEPEESLFTLAENLRAKTPALAELVSAARLGDVVALNTVSGCFPDVEARVFEWKPTLVLALHNEDRLSYNAWAFEKMCGAPLPARRDPRGPSPFRPGVPVRFTSNRLKSEGAPRGTLGEVLPRRAGDARAWVRTRDGQELPVPVPRRDLEVAYAVTVHDAQGAQSERVAVVLPARRSPLLTLETLYTAVSRAQRECSLWCRASLSFEERLRPAELRGCVLAQLALKARSDRAQRDFL